MTKVGIIFALKEELDALKEYLNLEKEFKIFELNFYEGNINGIKCVLVECGIGKVNAARTTQILIDNIGVDYIFNIGVAGGIDNSLNVGDIVIGNQLVQHDFDITAVNFEKGYIPNIGSKYIESDEYLVKKAEKSLHNNKELHIVTGTIASGDIFCTDPEMAKKINHKFEAICVEMEGASVAQVCFLNHIPFLIIRSISDTPNNNNAITYEEFLEFSSKNIAKAMSLLLQELTK
ncbi:MAG: 5'-methylthioadenosine/adenosylhomocysteine nucleosidase [Bacilli bacterium]